MATSVPFLLLLSVIHTSLGCSCVESSEKEMFCNADWVGLFKILEKPPRDDNRTLEYRAGIVKMFKSSNSSLTNGLRVSLETSVSAGLCGIEWLQTGKLYLLSGKVDGRVLKTSLCGQLFLEEWQKVPKRVKVQLKHRNYNSCASSTKRPSL
ncbi:hypothetical protein QR680_005342 [Steinernema hermaphroditum]|uniref:NTR domain-containing protein n=1 Tax=Steinernema hermaphroditum TaxID=289476 RepID=A0AA39HTV2_9BILA|nr:hypothetical protein QR680_005342 [Steinernema hermaphroditum]